MYATVSAVMWLAEELLVEYRTRAVRSIDQGHAQDRIEEYHLNISGMAWTDKV